MQQKFHRKAFQDTETLQCLWTSIFPPTQQSLVCLQAYCFMAQDGSIITIITSVVQAGRKEKAKAKMFTGFLFGLLIWSPFTRKQ